MIQYSMKKLALLLLLGVLPSGVMAAEQIATHTANRLELTSHWIGFLSIGLFVLAYLFVMAEEFTHLRKSKPVILAAGIIGWFYASNGLPDAAEHAVRHNLLEVDL